MANKFLNFLRVLCAAWVGLMVFLTGSDASLGAVLQGEGIRATPRSYVFDDVRGGGRLMLGAWGDIQDPARMDWYREAGLDFLIGPTPTLELLDACEANDVGMITHWSGAHPAVWGEHIVDEPGADAFPAIQAALAGYYANGTGRIPFVNLRPMSLSYEGKLNETPQVKWYQHLLMPLTDYSNQTYDAYRRYVADYVRTIDTDYISVDIYPLNRDLKTGERTSSNGDWLRVLDIIGEACRDTGRDMWVYTQAAGMLNDWPRWCDTKEDQLQQDYAALAFGARAIMYGCYQGGWWDDGSHMVTLAGERTDTYYAVQAANRELAPIKDIWANYTWRGAYLVNGAIVDGLNGITGDLHNGLAAGERLKLTSNDGLLVGCFDKKSGGGKGYVIVNMMDLTYEKSASLTVNFPAGKNIKVYGGGETQTYAGGSVKLTLSPGDGVFVTAG